MRKDFVRSLVVDYLGGQCSQCGSKKSLTLHHTLPLYAGGLNTMGNLEVVCRPCHHKLHTQLRLVYPYNKKEPDMQYEPTEELEGELLAMVTMHDGGMDYQEIADILNKGKGEVEKVMEEYYNKLEVE